MKNKLLSLCMIIFMLVTINISYSQDLTNSYTITIWNNNFKSQEQVHTLETIGFLPVFQNNRDEITIGNKITVLENSLDIQVIEDKKEGIKISLKYKDINKSYTKEILLQNKEIENLKDFKIRIEKK